MTRTDSIIQPDLISQAEKVIVIYLKQWKHNVRIYCISNTEINIILLHWNKQYLESGIIKWGCRLLNENFHLILMITCFVMQICHIGLVVEPYDICLGTRLTSTYLRSRHLHAVEKHTRTMVFWTFLLPVPPHSDDWHHHLDRCHKSESSDHRIWWRSQWQVL